MIGRITGTVIDQEHQQLLVDVSGVAYEIEVPLTSAYELAKAEGEVVLHTHFVVRDDANLLFGFPIKEERAVFRALLKVHNVGPRLALAVLSGLGIAEMAQAVLAGDHKPFKAIPGVGDRTAKQIVLDLKDKLPELPDVAPADKEGKMPDHVDAKPEADPEKEMAADAEAALLALGYKHKDAAAAVANVLEAADDLEMLLRLALKQLVQK